MPDNGRVIDIVAKLHADPASLIKTQKEFEAALRASGKNLDAERESLKIRDEHARASARELQLGQEIQQQRARNLILQAQENTLIERHNKAKAQEAAVASQVAQMEERSNAAIARQLDLANRIRERRKAGVDAQDLRGQQLQNIKDIQDAEADLAKGRIELERATSRVGKVEGELSTAKATHADAVKNLTQLEGELATSRERLTKLDQAHIEASKKLSQVYVEQRQHLRRLHDEEERGARRRPGRRDDREPPRSGGGSGGRGSGSGGGGRGGGGHIYRNASAFGDLFRSVPGSVGGPLGAVLGPLALADMVSYTEALTTAGQALAALPAVASAAGAAIGTLALGVHGFDDAIKNLNDPKKFVESIEHLAPAAQQAALEIQSLVQGPLGQLQRLVQQDLFKGVAAQIDSLATSFGPGLKNLTTGIATAFNGMFSSFTGALQSNHGSIDVIFDNIVTAFQRLEPAVKPFTDALVTITQVGSGFLPQLADSVTTMAMSFNTFIQKAASDGSLQAFIQKGIDAIGVLGQAALDLGKRLFDLFGNQSPEQMRKNINDIVDTMVTLAGVVQDVAHLINDWKPLLEAVAVGFAIFKVGGWVHGALNGIAKLVGVEGGIAGGLKALPGVAKEAGDGIAAALGKVAVPAWLSYLVGKENDSRHADIQEAVKAAGNGDPSRLNAEFNKIQQEIHGTPGTLPMGPPGYKETRSPAEIAKQNRQRNEGVPNPYAQPAEPSNYQDKPIMDYTKFMPQLSIQLPPGMQALPGISVARGAPAPLPGTAGAMFPGSPGARPQLQYGTDGTPFAHPELGYRKVNPAELNNSASELQKAAIDLGRANAELDGVLKNGLHTQQELIDAQMKQADAQRGFNEKQLEYAKNSMGKWTKVDANLAVFGEIGAHLDKDLGLSKGLPGLADNLVKFVASLATAPMMGKLAQEASVGDGSYGALGMMFGGYGTKVGVGPESFANAGVRGLGGASVTATTNINDLATAAANATRAFGGQPSAGGSGGSSAPTGGGWWPNLSNLPGMANAGGGGSYAGDAALLANVKPGTYVEPGGLFDFSQNLADCSSAIEGLVNTLDGKKTTGRTMATGNEAEFLLSHGFLPTDKPMPGTFQVGMNSHHTQATLPGGTNFNWGSQSAADKAGRDGAGAWDPSLTQHFYRPVTQSADQAAGALSNLTSAAQTAAQSTQGLAAPQGDSATKFLSTDQWDKIAGAEASGNWAMNSGNGFSGGLQFTPSTWKAFGGDKYAPEAWQASRTQQMEIGNKVLSAQGPGAWPTTSKAHPDWFKSMDLSMPGGLPSGGGQGLPIPAGPKLDFSGLGGGGGGDPFGFSKPPSSPSNAIADLLHSSTPNSADFTNGFAPIPGGPKFGGPGQIAPQTVGGMSMPPSVAAVAGPMAAAKQYTPQAPPEQQQGWQPSGGGGVGVGGGALGAAMAAGSMAANAFAPGAGAAAQTAMQLTNRTIQFGGQLAGIAAEGLLDTFMPSDPDSGKNPIKDSWLWRAAGALAGAAPALGSGAGLMDRVALKKQQDDAQGQQQGGNSSTTVHNAPVNMFNIAQGQNQSGKSLAQDVAQQLTLNAGNQFGGQP